MVTLLGHSAIFFLFFHWTAVGLSPPIVLPPSPVRPAAALADHVALPLSGGNAGLAANPAVTFARDTTRLRGQRLAQKPSDRSTFGWQGTEDELTKIFQGTSPSDTSMHVGAKATSDDATFTPFRVATLATSVSALVALLVTVLRGRQESIAAGAPLTEMTKRFEPDLIVVDGPKFAVAASTGEEKSDSAAASAAAPAKEDESKAPAPKSDSDTAKPKFADDTVGQALQAQQDLLAQAPPDASNLLGNAAGALVLVTLASAALSPQTPPKPDPPAVKGPAESVVVKVDTAKPAPVKVDTAKPAPAPAPAPAPVPAKPSPSAPAKPAAQTVPASPSSSPPTLPSIDFGFARSATNILASGLRTAADILPEAEKAAEKSAPAIVPQLEQGLQKVATGDLDESLPVVGNAALKAAEVVASTGLKVLSSGLGLAADSLPAVTQVAGKAIDTALPGVQAGAKAVAEAARSEAGKQDQGVAQALNTAASGLDFLSDNAKEAEKAAGYAVSKTLPILQAGLRATGQIASDVSNLEGPKDVSEIGNALKAVGADKVASQVGELAKQKLGK